MVEAGLIERFKEGDDQRLVCVRLTVKGRRMVEDYLYWLFDFEKRGQREVDRILPASTCSHRLNASASSSS